MTPLVALRQRLTHVKGIGRRIELGAGIAAAVLALLGLGLLLFAPLIAYCAVAARSCPAGAVRYESLLHARADAAVWLLVLAPLVLALLGAAGAVADAIWRTRLGFALLGAATALVLLLCLFGAAGLVALIYLPATLALALAAYGGYLGRSSARETAPEP